MTKTANEAGGQYPDRLYPTEREEQRLRELKEKFGIRESQVVQGTPDRDPAVLSFEMQG